MWKCCVSCPDNIISKQTEDSKTRDITHQSIHKTLQDIILNCVTVSPAQVIARSTCSVSTRSPSQTHWKLEGISNSLPCQKISFPSSFETFNDLLALLWKLTIHPNPTGEVIE